jgi:hypothetical protein
VPLVLLVVVALNQVRLVYIDDLSPWSGGGFGMFSTTDTVADRHLHIYELSPAMRREHFPPEDLEEEVLRALALPSERRLEILNRLLRERLGVAVTSDFEIQVWSRNYDAGNLRPENQLLRHYRHTHATAAE